MIATRTLPMLTSASVRVERAVPRAVTPPRSPGGREPPSGAHVQHALHAVTNDITASTSSAYSHDRR